MRRALFALVLIASPLFSAPPEVVVVRPVLRVVTDYSEFTGRVEPSATVQLRPREAGFLEKVLVKEGAEVKKGDLLFQLDDRIQRASLGVAEADLLRAEARLKQADVDNKRIQSLYKSKAVGQEELDKAVSAVEEAKASVLAGKAAVEVARLKVAEMRIVAPMAGRIGRVAADPGNVLKADEAVATIIAADPVFVTFDMDERSLLRFRRALRDQKGPDNPVPVGVGFADEDGYPRNAVLDLVDHRVDPDRGTIAVRARMPNPRNEILPGQFARVRLPLGSPRKVLLAPRTALAFTDPSGDESVLIVGADNRLKARPVRFGKEHDGLYGVERGLTEEDWIVRDARGHKEGDEITPKREAVPAEKSVPKLPKFELTAPPRPLADLPGSGPAILVTASYPGASSQVVDEVVAGPIDVQLDGLEGMVGRVRACSDDGDLRLTILFKPGTDLNKAQFLAQKRVELAIPVLPEIVRSQGVKIQKRGIHLFAIALTSPAGTYDRMYLSRFAELQMRDELARIGGVADVSHYGDPAPGPQARINIDSDRLAAHNLTVADVTEALRSQNLTAGPVGGKARSVLSVGLTGRLTEPETLGDVIVRTGKEGRVVRLRDLARIELAAGPMTALGVDGKPAAILLISRLADANAKDTDKAVRQRLAELAKRFPLGLEVKVIGE